MILNIISTIIALIIYEGGKKIVKIYIIKKNKDNLQKIIGTIVDETNIDNDFWEDKKTKWL